MKIRKTETNIKRIDRFKKTVAFVLFQILAISLFCVFGIAGTACATENNTTIITATVEDYKYYELKRSYRYKIYIQGDSYRTTSNFVTVNNEQFVEVLSESPLVSIRFDKRGNIAQMYSDDIEYVSLEIYNSEQTMRRIIAIIVFLIAELFVCVDYILYMMYHRTSKDKKLI